jgi:serine/threonine protein kinase
MMKKLFSRPLGPTTDSHLGGDVETGMHLFDNDLQPPSGWRLIQYVGHWHGKAYRATRESDGLAAVLEFIPLDDAGSSQLLEILVRVRDVSHPNLLGVLSAVRFQGGVVVATRVSEGGQSLGDLTRSRRHGESEIPQGEVLGYLRSAAVGIDFLGGQVCCPHNNTTPDNLIVSGGAAKLTRYGYPDAVDFAEDSSGVHPIGTQGYLPPERLLRGAATTQGDQYALAVIYVELRTGRNPLIPNRWEVMVGVEQPELGDLPHQEKLVVSRAMHANPEGRWPTCQAFVDALEGTVRRTRVRV